MAQSGGNFFAIIKVFGPSFQKAGIAPTTRLLTSFFHHTNKNNIDVGYATKKWVKNVFFLLQQKWYLALFFTCCKNWGRVQFCVFWLGQQQLPVTLLCWHNLKTLTPAPAAQINNTTHHLMEQVCFGSLSQHTPKRDSINDKKSQIYAAYMFL